MQAETVINHQAWRVVQKGQSVFGFIVTRLVCLLSAWAVGKALGWFAAARFSRLASYGPLLLVLFWWLMGDFYTYTTAKRRLIHQACSLAWLTEIALAPADSQLQTVLLQVYSGLTGQPALPESNGPVCELAGNLLLLGRLADGQAPIYFARVLPNQPLPIGLLPLQHARQGCIVLTTGDQPAAELPMGNLVVFGGQQLIQQAAQLGMTDLQDIQTAAAWIQGNQPPRTKAHNSPAGLAGLGGLLLGCAIFTSWPWLCVAAGLGLLGWAGWKQVQQKRPLDKQVAG